VNNRAGEVPGIGRAVSILIAILLHGLILFFTIFTIRTVTSVPGENPGVLKLADIREESAPRAAVLPSAPAAATETAAQRFVESEETESGGSSSGLADGSGDGGTDFLPMHLVSRLPRFSEDEIKRRVIYPPIAQRSELEGTVYLEIFVDKEGRVRSVSILREDPPGRGFGEAAAKAFQGLQGNPALANGQEVAVRYRYPVRFTLR
jgi:protein TonB